MADSPTGFLVQQRDDGFGGVFPLHTGGRYSLGRAPNSRIVLRDDLCSRYHAEVVLEPTGWTVRDPGSQNGTLVKDEPARRPIPLRPLDTVRLSRSNLVFVPTLDDLPSPPGPATTPAQAVEITRRLGQTKYLPPPAPPGPTDTARTRTSASKSHRSTSRRCGTGSTTCRCWPSTSSSGSPGRPAGR